ncbi:MAG TPA: hypothetical protein PKK94_11645, partial [Leptospiraceae bacterium]|nr:hypothetical protein [Leptospiraceae bacterium]
MNADQLSYLNRMIIERFRVLEKEKIEKDLQKFRLGEKVAFQDNEGIERKGVVIRINKKSISVHTDDRT